MEDKKSDNIKIEPFDGNSFALLPIAMAWESECNSDTFQLIAKASRLINDLVNISKIGKLFILEKKDIIIGFIGIILFINPLGTEIIASEKYWYVDPQYRKGWGGIKLLRTAMKWAKEMGALHFMATSSFLASELHDQVIQLYERMGMKKFEITYITSLLNEKGE